MLIRLKELEKIETQAELEERAEDLASRIIEITRSDIRDAYPGGGQEDDPDHVYGLASLKGTWMETLMIGRWIADAKNEILEAIRQRDEREPRG